MQNPEEEGAMFVMGDATAKLSSAIGSLPELLEQKRLIDLHTSVATTLLDNIKERKLDILFETEEKLLNGQGLVVVFFLSLEKKSKNEDFIFQC